MIINVDVELVLNIESVVVESEENN